MKIVASLLMMLHLSPMNDYSKTNIEDSLLGEWVINKIYYEDGTEISFKSEVFSFKKNQVFSSKLFTNSKNIKWFLSRDGKKLKIGGKNFSYQLNIDFIDNEELKTFQLSMKSDSLNVLCEKRNFDYVNEHQIIADLKKIIKN